MKLKRFFEFKKSDLEPVKSFKIQDELNPKIWDDMKMKKEIRKDLLKISEDFYENTDIKAEVKDITLVGSLCNYNWSEKYSDYDLHIIIDYKDVDDDYELVENLCDTSKKLWNLLNDIKVAGYDAEVMIQDEKDLKSAIKGGRIGGVFSLMNDKWIKKPEKVEFEPDEKMIERKGKVIMSEVDDIIKDKNKLEYEEIKKRIKKVWTKIKKLREKSLHEEGEFGTGNLVFKLLRRNNYLGKIMDLKRDAYAKQFESINERQTFSYFKFDNLSDDKLDEVFGFNRQDVEDTLQDIIDEYEFLPISINFNINNSYINDKDLDRIKDFRNKTCEIHFFIDGYTTKKMLNKLSGCVVVQTNYYRFVQDEINKIEKWMNFIENNFQKEFFENMGYEVEIKKKQTNGFINGLTINKIRPGSLNMNFTEEIEYSNVFLTIFIKDKK